MERDFLEKLQVEGQPLPEEIIDAILTESGQELSRLRLQSGLETAVMKAGGKSLKAITALLDLDSIAASEDLTDALEKAVAQVKKENGYLFESPAPPAFARFAGAAGQVEDAPATLAGAIRARMKG